MLEFLAQTTQSADVVFITEQVHAFYVDAWTKLAWLLGLVGSIAAGLATLVFIVLGWYLPRQRQRQEQKRFEQIRDELIKKVIAANEQIEEATKATEDQLKEHVLRARLDLLFQPPRYFVWVA